MFPIEKYKFYVNDEENPTKVYAISTYAGCTVKGISKCDPRDTFSLEKGKELAAARCNEKIAKRRFARAKEKYNEARLQSYRADARVGKMGAYFNDAYDQLRKARDYANKLLKEM